MFDPDARDTISCATGILMERYDWDAKDASDQLIEWSKETKIAVPDIAARLIAGVGQHAAPQM